MSQLNEVVLITKEDYTTLYTTGTVTTHGVTIPYDANSLYFSDDVSSEMIDDANSTKKFVTTAEKNTWNAKQNAITKQQDRVNFTGYTTETKIATINLPAGYSIITARAVYANTPPTFVSLTISSNDPLGGLLDVAGNGTDYNRQQAATVMLYRDTAWTCSVWVKYSASGDNYCEWSAVTIPV